jgi:hypothetical protein
MLRMLWGGDCAGGVDVPLPDAVLNLKLNDEEPEVTDMTIVPSAPHQLADAFEAAFKCAPAAPYRCRLGCMRAPHQSAHLPLSQQRLRVAPTPSTGVAQDIHRPRGLSSLLGNPHGVDLLQSTRRSFESAIRTLCMFPVAARLRERVTKPKGATIRSARLRGVLVQRGSSFPTSSVFRYVTSCHSVYTTATADQLSCHQHLYFSHLAVRNSPNATSSS